MTRQERAKQFMPFDAMKGLQEALRDREERHARVERHEISEDMQARISEVLARLERGAGVQVECYRAFHDVTLEGRVTDLNLSEKYLKLNGEKLFFADIYQIRILDYPDGV